MLISTICSSLAIYAMLFATKMSDACFWYKDVKKNPDFWKVIKRILLPASNSVTIPENWDIRPHNKRSHNRHNYRMLSVMWQVFFRHYWQCSSWFWSKSQRASGCRNHHQIRVDSWTHGGRTWTQLHWCSSTTCTLSHETMLRQWQVWRINESLQVCRYCPGLCFPATSDVTFSANDCFWYLRRCELELLLIAA